jgi:prepilin-type N-terminal cleavage/methylation domain-containing protein
METECVVPGAWYSMPRGRAAFTLVELIVVLAILGLISGVSGLALASLKAPRESEVVRQLRRSREKAILGGKPIHTVMNDASRTTRVLFFPDGRAFGPGVDPLTGALRDSLR